MTKIPYSTITYRDVEEKMFNIVTTRLVPQYGKYPERANAEPLTWEEACKRVRRLMAGIGKVWEPSNYLFADIEVSEWTPVLYAAYKRAVEKSDEETDEEVCRQAAKIDFMVAMLARLLGGEKAEDPEYIAIVHQAAAGKLADPGLQAEIMGEWAKENPRSQRGLGCASN